MCDRATEQSSMPRATAGSGRLGEYHQLTEEIIRHFTKQPNRDTLISMKRSQIDANQRLDNLYQMNVDYRDPVARVDQDIAIRAAEKGQEQASNLYRLALDLFFMDTDTFEKWQCSVNLRGDTRIG